MTRPLSLSKPSKKYDADDEAKTRTEIERAFKDLAASIAVANTASNALLVGKSQLSSIRKVTVSGAASVDDYGLEFDTSVHSADIAFDLPAFGAGIEGRILAGVRTNVSDSFTAYIRANGTAIISLSEIGQSFFIQGNSTGTAWNIYVS
jgi:hypothetical protein